MKSIGPKRVATVLLLSALVGLAGLDCRGRRGPAGTSAPPTPTPTTLAANADLPGVNIAIAGIGGSSGSSGRFRAGDAPSVTFTIKKDDGTNLPLTEFDFGGIFVSGPTTNYQIVIPEKLDLRSAARDNGDGSWTYALPAIPGTFAPPINAHGDPDAGSGNLQGRAIQDGTYTVGIELYKNYTVGTKAFRDTGNATADFLLGESATLEPRQVVTRDNCNQCHVNLQAHGGIRKDTRLCVLCHTSGSLDNGFVAGGATAQSIDSRVMFHKIHDAAHLPSVVGEHVNAVGIRDFGVAPGTLVYIGFQNRPSDFTAVNFPVWPSLSFPMPRETEYNSLNPAGKLKSDAIRQGVVDCGKCHGGPEGTAATFAAPAQGNQFSAAPSRRACGSCHDDIDFTKSFTRNGQTMPPQATDADCLASGCHVQGTALGADKAHVHPMVDPAVNPGLDIAITDVAGSTSGSGKITPGESLQITFTCKDDAGNPVTSTSASSPLTALTLVVAGPTGNRQIVLNVGSLQTVVTDAQPITFTVAGFAFPADFPAAPPPTAANLNYSGFFGETGTFYTGDWGTGPAGSAPLHVVPGTYAAALYGSRTITDSRHGVATTYTIGPQAATRDFLVNNPTAFPDTTATTIEPEGFISSESNCDACHNQVIFHGGSRKGLATCLVCHADPGAEDRAQAVAANAPATPGVTIDFRVMLHKIHMGANLAKAADYEVVGFGPAPAPDNFSVNTYEDIEFPAMPDGARDCRTCHGPDSTSWEQPNDRTYPAAGHPPALVWKPVCNSCHDSDAATAHIDQNTGAGNVEQCPLCHGPGREEAVSLLHKVRSTAPESE